MEQLHYDAVSPTQKQGTQLAPVPRQSLEKSASGLLNLTKTEVAIINLKLSHASFFLEVTSKVTSFGLSQKSDPSPAPRNPQSSSIKQLKEIVHRLIQATERDREGLFFLVTVKSAYIWPINEWWYPFEGQKMITLHWT